MYKVRFHLAKGLNFEKWQVTNLANKEVMYYDPYLVAIKLDSCTLKNSKATANKIHCGQNKTVCAWIECEHIQIDYLIKRYECLIISKTNPILDKLKGDNLIYYNPKNKPYWIDSDGTDIDGKHYAILKTFGKQLYFIKNYDDYNDYNDDDDDKFDWIEGDDDD